MREKRNVSNIMKKLLGVMLTAVCVLGIIVCLQKAEKVNAATPVAWVEYDGDMTLTFRYDTAYPGNDNNSTSGKAWWKIPDDAVEVSEASDEGELWFSKWDKIKKVNFVEAFEDYQPTSTSCWFDFLECLTSINGLDYLNTEKVTNMSYMFAFCKNLTYLDLSSFNTEQVTDMQSMFDDCINLRNICVSTSFKTKNCQNSDDMFSGCTNLKGGKGTKYNSTYTDKSYAKIDGGTSDPGYFSNIKNSEAWVEYDGDKTLTFRYDAVYQENDNNSTSSKASWYIPDDAAEIADAFNNGTLWFSKKNKVQKIIFAESFCKYAPTSTSFWFSEFESLTSLIGLQNLNTSDVTDMSLMFYGCSAIESLDLSSFNTEKVTDMSYMFYDCSAIKDLDLSSFNTEKVTNMSYMFAFCKNLTYLDLSSFNTEQVTDMQSMFDDCSNIQRLNLNNFNTKNVENMSGMFCDCSRLQQIIVSDFFQTDKYITSTSMFLNCTNLKGGKGTKYDSIHTDISYARIDGGTSNPGYFTSSNLIAWVEYDGDMTLTFRYDTAYPGNDNNSTSGKAWWKIPDDAVEVSEASDEGELWFSKWDKIKKVNFVEAFEDYQPTSTSCWFSFLANLTSIKGLYYLNTENVTNMSAMFDSCSNLQSLDLRCFNTEKVTDMRSMFYDCESLQNILVSNSFKTDSCTDSQNMFANCDKLKGGKGTLFNDSKTDKAYAKADMGASNPGYFTNINDVVAWVLYDGDKTLTFRYDTAYPGSDNDGENGKGWWRIPDSDLSEAVSNDKLWFSKRWSVQKIFIDFSFINYKAPSTSLWFDSLYNVISIFNLEYLNTANVTDMHGMFGQCSKLSSLDLNSFDTAKVINMDGMFMGCSELQKIFVSDFFDMTNCPSSNNMFSGCTSLTGEKGTSYNENNTDSAYACIDKGSENPGYFTDIKDVTAWVHYDGDKTLTFYYDTNYPGSNTGNSWRIPKDFEEINRYRYRGDDLWFSKKETVEKIIIDKSIQSYKPISTASWFSFLPNVTTIKGLEYLDTANVNDMSYMFNSCQPQSLDLRTFDTAKVENMTCMFDCCSNLKLILVSDLFKTDSCTESSNMFRYCKNLKGGWGTQFDNSKCDKSYAKADKGASNPGYFTDISDVLPWVHYDGDKTLTFRYDTDFPGTNTNEENGEAWWIIPDASHIHTAWENNTLWFSRQNNVQEIVLDWRLTNYKAKSMTFWFAGFDNVTSITGLEYLNTGNVRDMSGLFCNCSKLQSLDLRTFDTAKVEKMTGMFDCCSNLKLILVSDLFKTDSCTESLTMFRGCNNLKGGKGTLFNDSKTDKAYAKADMGASNPGYFTNINDVVAWVHYDGDKTLTFRYDADYPGADKDSENGEAWWIIPDDSHIRTAWNNNTLWFSKHDKVQRIVIDWRLMHYKPTSMMCWFANFDNVTSITGLKYLNTENVRNMYGLFYGCSKLQSLDLTSFDTSATEDISAMFQGCNNLKYIFASDSFNSTECTTENTQNTFLYCYNLIGEKGSKYRADEDYYSIGTYAHIDGGTDNPGYFSTLSSRKLTITSCEHGTITADTEKEYYCGDEVTFTSTPENGYQLKAVSVFIADNPNVTVEVDGSSFIMPNFNVIISAEFEKTDEQLFSEYIADIITKLNNLGDDVNGIIATAKFDVNNLKQASGMTLQEKKDKANQILSKASSDLESAKKAASDVTTLINKIGTVEYTDTCWQKIDAARKAYDALTDDQKKLVSSTDLTTLTEAEESYKQLREDSEFKEYIDGIFTELDNLGVDVNDIIATAKVNINNLTQASGMTLQEKKAKADQIALQASSDLESARKAAASEADKAAASAVSDLIIKIGTVKYSDDCWQKIDAARKAYDALTDDQKKLVIIDLTTLTEAEKRYKQLKEDSEFSAYIADIIAKLDKLGDDVNGIIATAKNNLTLLQQASEMTLQAKKEKADQILSKASSDLESAKKAAKEAADKAAASDVTNLINKIGTVEYSDTCWQKIDDARKAYDALTDDQKKLVSSTDLTTLTEAEESYKQLKNTSGGNTSGGNTSGGNTSGGNTSGGNTSGGNTSGGNTSGGSYSGGDIIDLSVIHTGEGTEGTDVTDGNTTGEDTKGTDVTDGNTTGEGTEGTDVTDGNTTGEGTEGTGSSGNVQNDQKAVSAPVGKKNVSVKKGKAVIPSTVTINGEEQAVTKLSADAFSNSKNLKTVELPATIEEIGKRSFKNCQKLTEIKLSESLRQISQSGFYGCSSLKDITLGDNVKTIGAYAFKNCTSLKEITLGKGVKTLSRSVFSGCTSLESIVIPTSVKSMGANMFYGCSSLKEITIKSTKLTEKTLAKDAFKNVPKDMVIYVPKSKLSTYKALFQSKGLSTKVKVKAIKKK